MMSERLSELEEEWFLYRKQRKLYLKSDNPSGNLDKLYVSMTLRILRVIAQQGYHVRGDLVDTYEVTEKNSKLDCNGVDVLVYTDRNNKLPLQVTGGTRNAKNRRSKNRDIPVVNTITGNGNVKEPKQYLDQIISALEADVESRNSGRTWKFEEVMDVN